jgi:glycosyltransferase involved in cell wall biosynthesis
MQPLTVIVPASNEQVLIGRCLDALAASHWTRPEPVRVIVVANGCHDDTAGVARDRACAFAARGWTLGVIERAEGGKPGALNAGDAAAADGVRVYLDADVTVAPALLQALAEALETDAPRYASGRVQIAARGAVSRAYARTWRRVPFMACGVPGCGLFAVNPAGRARWRAFPRIISDDTFVRLCFAPHERLRVAAAYRWPVAEGFLRLVRVRRRQDAGVDEIAARYPALMGNDDKPAFPAAAKLRLALSDPIGFSVYAGVALAVKLSPRTTGWSRGR